jgi:hypothetical protein
MRNTGSFGLIIGLVVAIGAALFILSGGDLGGKTTVESDKDLPPIATANKD